MSSDSASQTYGPLERMLPTAESDDWFDLAIVVPDWALADFNSAISQSETVEPRENPYRSRSRPVGRRCQKLDYRLAEQQL